MSTFGIFILETLAAHGKNAAWLAEQIGVRPQTVSAWKTKADRNPKPAIAYKVARIFEQEFGISHDRTAQAAGYPFRFSDTPDEQSRRLNDLAAASPRAARNFTRIAKLPSREQDEVLSIIEAWMATKAARNRKRPQGSK